MTLPVWFTATPAKSGSVMGVEIHLAGKWLNDGNEMGKLAVVFVLKCIMGVTYIFHDVEFSWLECEPPTSRFSCYELLQLHLSTTWTAFGLELTASSPCALAEQCNRCCALWSFRKLLPNSNKFLVHCPFFHIHFEVFMHCRNTETLSSHLGLDERSRGLLMSARVWIGFCLSLNNDWIAVLHKVRTKSGFRIDCL